MADDLDVGNMNMAVLLDEVGAKDRSEKFRRIHRMLFGQDIGRVLHRVRSHDGTIVCFGVAIGGQLRIYIQVFVTTYEASISPSSKTQTVISVTVWVFVASSFWTLYRRMLSFP